MDLTKLPKTNAYRIQNEETIQKLCARFKIPPKAVPKTVKDKPWVEKYPFYLEYITGHFPCPICNGPMVKYSRRLGVLYPNSLQCADHPSHTSSISVAEFALAGMLKDALRKDPENALLKKARAFQTAGTKILLMDGLPGVVEDMALKCLLAALGPVCSHGDYLVDCEICSNDMQSLWEERQAVAVGEGFATAEVSA